MYYCRIGYHYVSCIHRLWLYVGKSTDSDENFDHPKLSDFMWILGQIFRHPNLPLLFRACGCVRIPKNRLKFSHRAPWEAVQNQCEQIAVKIAETLLVREI